MSVAVAVAVAAIGAGTWVLGSGPDAPPVPEGAASVIVVPELPAAQHGPVLSVAPAPSEAAYAAARKAGERASRDGKGSVAPKKKAGAKAQATASRW